MARQFNWKILELLKSIKFWTIIGTVATITAALVTIFNQPKSNKLGVYFQKYELENSETISIYYQLPKSNADFYFIPSPVYLYNANDKAVTDVTAVFMALQEPFGEEYYYSRLGGEQQVIPQDETDNVYHYYHEINNVKPHSAFAFPKTQIIFFNTDPAGKMDGTRFIFSLSHDGLKERNNYHVEMWAIYEDDDNNFLEAVNYLAATNSEDKNFKDVAVFWLKPKLKEERFDDDGHKLYFNTGMDYNRIK